MTEFADRRGLGSNGSGLGMRVRRPQCRRADRVYLVLFELERGRSEVVLHVRKCGGGGDGQCDGRDSQQPGEGDLVGAGAVLGGGFREDRLVCRVAPRSEGAVRDGSCAVRLALSEHVVLTAGVGVEAILHSCDVRHCSGNGELFRCDIGDANVPDPSLDP
jgi:hypothetical protein